MQVQMMNIQPFYYETLNEEDKNIISNILYDAFDMKFGPLFKKFSVEDCILIIKESLQQATGLMYKEKADILGVAVFTTKDHPAMLINSNLRKQLGWFTYYFYRKIFLSENLVSDEIIKLDLIATRAKTRGKGVGSQLIKEMIEYAINTGYKKVTLEVVDTNPRAKLLYERLGFTTYKHHHTGILTRVFDFRGYDDMSLSINEGSKRNRDI